MYKSPCITCVQYRGGYHACEGYHEYCGECSVPWGKIFCYSSHDIPHMYHDIPHGTQITKDGIP